MLLVVSVCHEDSSLFAKVLLLQQGGRQEKATAIAASREQSRERSPATIAKHGRTYRC
jgi:hypothetical protein